MENKNENKAKCRTTAQTNKYHTREEAELPLPSPRPAIECAAGSCEWYPFSSASLSPPNVWWKTQAVLKLKLQDIPVLQNAFGHSSLIIWMGSKQAVTDIHQQPATAPSLPLAEGAVGLMFGKIPRYHKPAAVSLHSNISVSNCICNHQGTGYKAQAYS